MGCRSVPARGLQVEDDFEELLHSLISSKTLFYITHAMFKKAWKMRLTQAKSIKTSMKKEVAKLETQIEHIVDRIVDTVSPMAISAYEKRIYGLRNTLFCQSKALEEKRVRVFQGLDRSNRIGPPKTKAGRRYKGRAGSGHRLALDIQ